MRNPKISMAMMAIALAICVAPAIGQQQGGQAPSQPSGGGNTGGGGAGAGAGAGAGTRTPTTPTPTTPTQPRQPDFGQQQQQYPMMRQPVFLSGKVVLDDGTPPPETVVIETVCGGVVRPQAYTDSKGRFSFQVGQNTNMMMDASVSSIDTPFPRGGTPGGGASLGRGGSGGMDLMGCELRASLAGFRSDLVNLSGRRAMENPEVGIIVLRRMGNVEGTTISFTSLQAPKDAKKAYDKGVDALKKKKWAEAQTSLEKAVAIYPKYAAAWFELGRSYQGASSFEKARDAYAKSLESDAKFLKPYMQLALMAANERKWEDVERYTSELLRLDPVDFAPAYFYNSVANFNLRKLDAAERSAREGLKLDSQHQIPKMEHVLGVILANKRDYAGAAQYFRNYLEHAPGASDADAVRKQLSELERFTGPAAAQAQQP